MSEKFSQKRLVGIAREFSHAALKKQYESAFEDRMLASAGKNELSEFKKTANEFLSLKSELGNEAGKDPAFIGSLIKMADQLADMYSRFCSKEEIRALLPKDASQAAPAFEARGARDMAKICAGR